MWLLALLVTSNNVNTLFGSDQRVDQATEMSVVGVEHRLNDIDQGTVVGHAHRLSEVDMSTTMGSDHVVSDSTGVVTAGTGLNVSSADYSVLIGYQSSVVGADASVLIGTHLVSSTPSQVVLGRHNVDTPDATFVVADGNVTHAHNVFEVLHDGDIRTRGANGIVRLLRELEAHVGALQQRVHTLEQAAAASFVCPVYTCANMRDDYRAQCCGQDPSKVLVA